MSQEDQKNSLKGNSFSSALALGALWGMAFALAESMTSLLKYSTWHKADGVILGLKIEALSLAVYIPVALCISILIYIFLHAAGKTGLAAGARGRQEEIISGVLAWPLVFSLLECFAPPKRFWDMAVQAFFFSTVALLAAVGVGMLAARVKEKNNHGPAKALLLLALAGLAFNHVFMTSLAKLELRGLLHVFFIALLIIAFALFFLAGLKWLGSRKKSAAYLWSAVFFLAFIAPVFALEWNESKRPAGEPPENPKNIIVILSDTCRADAIGIYGGDNQTPNIDRMAREGVVFRRAFSQAPWTMPSMLSAISSLYPSVVQRGRLYQVPPEVTTMTEVLDSNGYFTRLIMGNYSMGDFSGFTQGFDEYEVYNQFHRLHHMLPMPVFYKIYYLFRRAFNLPMFPDFTQMITAKALAFLDSPGMPRPFFMWLHYMDPHEPLDPPERFIQKKFNTQLHKPFAPNNPWHIKGNYSDPQGDHIRIGILHLTFEDKAYLRYLYDAEVRYLDEKVGELMACLEQKGLLDETLLVFTSDHGEEFWEHDDWGHGQSLYNEQLHIPLIMWGAGIPRREVEDTVELLDLAPTLLEFLGLPVPGEFQGKSLMGLIIRGEKASSRPAFAEATRHFEEMKSIQDEKAKLIWKQENKKYELYNLLTDWPETINLYGPDHPDFRRLENELWPWVDENLRLQKEVTGLSAAPGYEDEVKRRLRAIGYLK